MFKFKISISLFLFAIYSNAAILELSKDSPQQINVVLLILFGLLMFLLPWGFNIHKRVRFAIGVFGSVILHVGLGLPLLLAMFSGEPSVTSVFNIEHLLTGSLLSEVLCIMLSFGMGILFMLVCPVTTFKSRCDNLTSSYFDGTSEYRIFKIILFVSLSISIVRYLTGASDGGGVGAANGNLALALLNVLGTACASMIVFSASMAVSQSNYQLGRRAFGLAAAFAILNFILFLSKLFIFTLILALIFYHIKFGFSKRAIRRILPLAILGLLLYPFANIFREYNQMDTELSVFNLIVSLENRLKGDLDLLEFVGYAFNSVLSRIGLLHPLVHAIENFDSKFEIYAMAAGIGGGSVSSNISYAFFGITYPFGYSLGFFGGTYFLVGFTGVLIISFLTPYIMLFIASLPVGRMTTIRTYLACYSFFYISLFFLNGPMVNWSHEVLTLFIGLSAAFIVNLKFRLR